MENNIIKFVRQKDFKFIKEIGQGGTGRTVLLEDETISEQFVCKKYSPDNPLHKEQYFPYFINEIKILHSLYHRNIVRVFNYFLYPSEYTGYILMEFVKGEKISDFLRKNPDKLNDVFIQVVEGFKYLEDNKVLHRDIRPDNILVSEDGIVKIIDFGFGKKFEIEGDNSKSISLNWRYSVPEEFSQKKYDSITEVYFVGKLFEEIISDNNLSNFGYFHILQKMINKSYSSRTQSFFEIQRSIITDKLVKTRFSSKEKSTYMSMGEAISSVLAEITPGVEYLNDIEFIILNLDNLYKDSMLETYIQNPNYLIRCFMKGKYTYWKTVKIQVSVLKEFITFFKSVTKDKQKIVLNNIWKRLDAVDRKKEKVPEEIPF